MTTTVQTVPREDLDPIERAEALQGLRKALRTTWDGIARHRSMARPRRGEPEPAD